jgi:Ser/Thr protein kinase RdoA (MazF antagonist)
MKMDQAGQFAPTPESIQAILTEYNLTLGQFEPAMSGIENTTLLVVALAQQFVLRVYRHRRKSDAMIRRELAFIKYLAAAGLPTVPAIVNRSGQSYTRYGKWRAILMPFRPGYHPSHYTAALVSQMAQTQATMHQLAARFGRPPLWELPLFKLKETYFHQHIDRRQDLKPAVKDFLDRVKSFNYRLDHGLPKGYCHLDFSAGNVLVGGSGELAAILDFDDLAHAPYVVCLGYTLWSLYQQEDPRLFAQYLDAYQAVRPLSQVELASLPAVMLFRHYTVGAMKILEGTMDDQKIGHYVRLESQLARECYTESLTCERTNYGSIHD